jgi:hypothetical protein
MKHNLPPSIYRRLAAGATITTLGALSLSGCGGSSNAEQKPTAPAPETKPLTKLEMQVPEHTVRTEVGDDLDKVPLILVDSPEPRKLGFIGKTGSNRQDLAWVTSPLLSESLKQEAGETNPSIGGGVLISKNPDGIYTTPVLFDMTTHRAIGFSENSEPLPEKVPQIIFDNEVKHYKVDVTALDFTNNYGVIISVSKLTPSPSQSSGEQPQLA